MSPPTGKPKNERSETLTIKCETCANNINKNQAVFRCMFCEMTMHMTSNCTKMSERVIAVLQELNVNIFLICNQGVSLNRRDRY